MKKETGGFSHQKKKKSVGYVKPEVDQKDNVSGWEGFVETLSKSEASHLSQPLKNIGKHVVFPNDIKMEKEKDLSEQMEVNEKKRKWQWER